MFRVNDYVTSLPDRRTRKRSGTVIAVEADHLVVRDALNSTRTFTLPRDRALLIDRDPETE